MTLEQFVIDNDVEYCKNLIRPEGMAQIAKAMGVTIGKELEDYILRYGYLAYQHVELYGINSKQVLDSDMVKQTIYLHERYPETQGYVALENLGEGDYRLVDQNDHIYEFDARLRGLCPAKEKLNEYILHRFGFVNTKEGEM